MRMNAEMHRVGPGEDEVDLAVGVFRMLADPTRLRLLWHVSQGERTVGELADLVDKAAPAVSQHLAKLRMARLVLTRREGVQIHYRVANEHIARLVADALYNAEHALSPDPAHHRGEAASRGAIA